jgi:hypothetical protein
VNLDPPSGFNPIEKKKEVREQQINWVFQDVWVAKLSWADVVIGFNEKVIIVRHWVCKYIKGRKSLGSQFDSL